eukprot:m.1103405 g.1103405  ORF g.1103405 m.1103405 type:complete len:64 (-) comp24331_c2_seq15:1-192(-)
MNHNFFNQIELAGCRTRGTWCDQSHVHGWSWQVKWQSDDQIAYNTATATMAVFRRAGITIPQQ